MSLGRTLRYVDSHVHLDHVVRRLQLLKPGQPLGAAVRLLLRESVPGTVRRAAAAAGRARPWGAEAAEPQLGGVLHVACDPAGLRRVAEIQDADERVRVAVGLHPSHAAAWTDELGERITALASAPGSGAAAWGECGLDYHHVADAEGRRRQRRAFVAQLRCARALCRPGAPGSPLPVVLHARDAEGDALAVLRDELPAGTPLHVHCHTGTAQEAERFLAAFPRSCIGFTGACSFRRADVVGRCQRDRPRKRASPRGSTARGGARRPSFQVAA
eukprot:TRINITY_DN27494_c0_g1_i1.p2 TRINITY_DN27494_c0_g1~~TRINITY_DN27494_c0_g1_i1.p2  ORF type:complete len:273 (+),score=29.27 TRINITY_DN27494_c0_g1_i1:75-893(+)